MRTLMVRYKVKADRVAENENYVSKVFDELHKQDPSGFRYASFKLEDGVSFVHLVFEGSTNGNNSLGDLSAFQAFVSGIEDRCDEPPVATELTEVGSYRLDG
ncbi:MAG: hypothetical protein WD646_14690 [Actinomycetota bacterium]